MRAVKLPAHVSSDHTLRLELPEDIGEGPAEVIVLVAEPDDDARTGAASLREFLAGPRVDRKYVRSKAEIDEYLRAERESWE